MSIYGKTWWGKKWLEAFSDIDHSNRLPRGKTYANSGRVKKIDFNANRVSAKVEGSFGYEYDVLVSVTKFTDTEKEIIANIINSSPAFVSALVNKKLPEDLFYELEKHKIKLFSSKWRELDADCDCPDGAMPCKHIAAIIYMIAAEIDQDPFLIFALHGCYLSDMVKDISLDEFCSIKRLATIGCIFAPQIAIEPDKEAMKSITFSPIQNISYHIFAMLKPDPVFYDKDFKALMQKIYQHWNKNYDKTNIYFSAKQKQRVDILKRSKDESDEEWQERLFDLKWDNPHLWGDFSVNIDKKYNIVNIFNGSEDIFTYEKEKKYAIAGLMTEISQNILHKYNYNIQFLYLLMKFVFKLLDKSAFIPQVLQNADNETIIRWIPALFDKNVDDVFKKLCLACPANLVTYNRENITPEEQVKTIIGFLLSAVTSFVFPSVGSQLYNNEIFGLFFKGEHIKFNDIKSKGYTETINQWLSNLYLTEKDYKLFLSIKEDDGEFTIELEASFDGKVPQSASKLMKSKDKKLKLLSDISLIQDFIPKLGKSIDDNVPIGLGLEEFSNFFLNITPLLKIMGIAVVLPKSLRNHIKPRLIVNMKAKNKLKRDVKGFLSFEDMVNFDWQIALGDQDIGINEFKKLLKESKGLIKFANEYIILDENEIQSLMKKIDKLPENLSQNEIMHAILGGELDGADVNIDGELQALIEAITTPKDVSVPTNLNANLRPYQERGFSWLIQNINCGFGSILADDMGLGKTIQIIATMLYLKNNGLLNKEKVLIVAPTTLLFNWEREIAKFAPELSTFIYHGQNRELEKNCDVLITSYGLVRRDEEKFNKKKWLLLVIDEAQNIKTPTTQQTKVVKSIKATHKIALTGTPVENRLFDYWSIFDFTNKHYLHGADKFKKKFVMPIENDRDKDVLEVFKKITSPFILRRLKSDKSIISDLPDKIENDCYCLLTPKQTAMYQEVLNETIRQLNDNAGSDMERKGLILKLINSLKQICNHPAQFSKKEEVNLEESGKIQMLLDILQNIGESSEKVLIFTQYVEMGNIIIKAVEQKLKTSAMFLHGGLSRKARDEMVNEFQNNSQKRIFVISLKAGGTGLNLTQAKHVIHYDLWWNPAVENQATDRAYRIGQNSNVMVHRFISTGTFEEKINSMINSKKELAELTVGGGESFITEMSNKELKDLLSLRI